MRNWSARRRAVSIVAAVLACGCGRIGFSGGPGDGDGGAGVGDGGDLTGDGGAVSTPPGMPAGVCTLDGWCWENPVPIGSASLSIDGTSDGDVWFTGKGGLAFRWDGTMFRGYPTPTRADLNGVWAWAADDVWTVGDGGVALRWNGSAWNATATGTTADLFDIWGRAANDTWAVGDDTVRRWNGASWQVFDAGNPARVFSFASGTANEVFIGGSDSVRRQMGAETQFSSLPASGAALPLDLYALTTTEVLLADIDEVSRWNGNGWTSLPGSGVTSGFVERGNELLLATSTGTLRYTPSGFEPVPELAGITPVWIASTGQVWGRGANTSIARLAGGVVTDMVTGFRQDLEAVCGMGVDDVWAVGGGQHFMHWDGTAWALVPRPAGVFRAVLCRAVDDVWAIGDAGAVVRWDGASWQAIATPVTNNLTAIWGDATTVWIGGAGGVLARSQGSGFVVVSSLFTTDIASIWGSSATDVWILGVPSLVQDNELARWNGTTLALTAAPAGQYSAIGGSGASDAWLVGDQTQRWNGSQWSAVAVAVPMNSRLEAVWANGTTEAWAVGDSFFEGGLVYRWNGASWTRESTGSGALAGVYGAGARVWTVGSAGTILRRGP